MTGEQTKNLPRKRNTKFCRLSFPLMFFLVIGPKAVVSVLQTLFDYIITSGLSQHSDLFKEM